MIVHRNKTIQVSDFQRRASKRNALTKLARMSRVRHNAKSIENRYNSLKILKKPTKGCHFEKDK
jgi:hypothetical protein